MTTNGVNPKNIATTGQLSADQKEVVCSHRDPHPDPHPYPELSAERDAKYPLLWGREPRVFRDQSSSVRIDIFHFPKTDADVPFRDLNVYMTGGMADVERPVPPGYEGMRARFELVAFADENYKDPLYEWDLVVSVLMRLVDFFHQSNTGLAPGLVFGEDEPIMSGSEMTGYMLTRPPRAHSWRYSKYVPHVFEPLQVVLLSRAEMHLLSQGNEGESVSLLRMLERAGVANGFHPRRKSLV